MCDVLPGYSCDKTPIDSNVVGAWDEHYRRDQTHIPQRYLNACDGEGCGGVVDSGCGTEVDCGDCPLTDVEHFRGGRRGGGRRGGGRGWGGRRAWRHRGYGYAGYPYWGWSSPYYYGWNRPTTTTVIKAEAPKSNDNNKALIWLLIGGTVAMLWSSMRK